MGKTIAEKLGFKDAMTVRLDGAPAELDLGLPSDRSAEYPDLLLFFVAEAAAVLAAIAKAEAAYRDGARLWFAYPKKTGTIGTDISRDDGWLPVLQRGFLPVTQIAIDATWSALRFRRRHEIAKLTRKTNAA